MKTWSLLLFCILLTGCVTNPDTGASEIFGVIPVEDAVNTADVVAQEAKGQGGILGVVGTAVASAIALWRRKRELSEKSNAEKAKAVAGSVIDGVDAILAKIEEEKSRGGSWAPTKEELLALVKAAQDSAGTRDGVKALINEKHTQG